MSVNAPLPETVMSKPCGVKLFNRLTPLLALVATTVRSDERVETITFKSPVFTLTSSSRSFVLGSVKPTIKFVK